MKVETVKVNGVTVNKGDEETAAKWAKRPEKKEASVDDTTETKKTAKKDK